MAQVTSPIILDSTGQQIHSDLQQIKNVLTTPSTAADITFDNTGTGMQADDVQDAITELKSNLTDNTIHSVSTSASGVTVQDGGYWEIGSLVIVNVRINVSSALTGVVSGIITGLPHPKTTNEQNTIPMLDSNGSAQGPSKQIFINQSYDYIQSNDGLASGVHFIGGTYVKDNS